MNVLWDSPDVALRVREVLERLPREPVRAYTTVMTVLDNLHTKGWVVRRTAVRGYLYQPANPREEVAAQAMRDWQRPKGPRPCGYNVFVATPADLRWPLT
jgi:predicted transcriptional regulator